MSLLLPPLMTNKLNSPSSVDAGCKATVPRIKAPTIACVVSDDFLYDEVEPVDMDDDARGDVGLASLAA